MENNQEIQNQVEFFYNASAKQLYNLALYTVGYQKVAEQITIDAFSQAFYNISDKTDVDLKELSIKLLYKYGRKIRKKHEYNGYTVCVRTSEYIEKQIDVKKKELIEMLNSLSFDERYILLLFCWQRFSISQIAKTIRLPVFFCKKRLYAAMKKATRCLQGV